MDDEYELVTTLKHHNGETRVYRPILSPEERARREKALRRAAANFLMYIENEKARSASEEKKL